MSEIRVDTISEKTSANGVAVDGVTIKDGNVGATGTATSVAGIPLFSDTSNGSIYTHDVSGTDDTAANNTAFGLTAMDAITTGDSNVAIGHAAGSAMTTSEKNVIVGKDAGLVKAASSNRGVHIGFESAKGLTTGSDILSIGYQSYLAADTETHNLAIGRAALGGAINGGEYNVAIGNFALDALTSGDTNVAIGYNAGSETTTGGDNTFMGYQAGRDNTTGGGNIAIGAYSMFQGTTTGGSNVGVGNNTLEDLTSGTRNIAIGSGASQAYDTENDNLAIGSNALAGAVAGGEYNVAIGNFSLDALTSGDDNIAIGYNAGTAITSGYNNTLIGKNAGQAITSGARNTFVGYQAGDGFDGETHNVGVGENSLGGPIAGGEYNVAVGTNTLDALTSGDTNVAVGHNAGTEVTTGGENVIIGEGAGDILTSGNSNTFVGANAGNTTDTAANNICIGVAARTSGALSITIGIDIEGSSNNFKFGKPSNVVSNDFSADASFSRSSDERKKTNIEESTLGLNFINELRPVTFNWRPNNEFPKTFKDYKEKNEMTTDITLHGMIAQDVKKALDKVNVNDFGGWSEEEDGSQRLSQEMFVHPLIKAVQELSATVTTLQQEIKILKEGL